MSKKRFAFVLRVWNEATPAQEDRSPEVRGSLQLANSDEIRYFHSLDEIPAILRNMTGWNHATRPNEGQSPQK